MLTSDLFLLDVVFFDTISYHAICFVHTVFLAIVNILCKLLVEQSYNFEL
jgi:hypothetical protein